MRQAKTVLLTWTAVVLVVFAAGYLSGRERILGRMQGFMTSESPELSVELRDVLKSGPEADVAKSSSYAQLDSLLDVRLESQRSEGEAWRELLNASDEAAQAGITTELRAEFLDLLRPWPGPDTDLEAEKRPWFSKDGIEVYSVHLQTHPGVFMTCALLQRRDHSSPAPALLVLHGFEGSLQSVVADIDYHHGFGMTLAREGFTVLAPLCVTTTVSTRSSLHIKALASGWTLRAVDLWQLSRALDYLIELENVDRTHIGVYGISRGGQNALQLGALDDRLSLVVCSGYFADRFFRLFQNGPLMPGRHIDIAPNMGFLFDDLNLVALIQPKFFCVESGNKDPRTERGVVEFEKVRQLYQHLGYSERAEFVTIEGGHETSVPDLLPFLSRWANTDLPR